MKLTVSFGVVVLAASLCGCSSMNSPNTRPGAAARADCLHSPPTYLQVAQSFEASCSTGQTIIDVRRAKSPVVALNLGRAQEVTVSTVSGAKSPGGNGSGAQVCIWRSWDASAPCGASPVSPDGFNDWDGRAECGLKVPAGMHYIRALQVNNNADEGNTTITVKCR
jgi:hypothetical protein